MHFSSSLKLLNYEFLDVAFLYGSFFVVINTRSSFPEVLPLVCLCILQTHACL